MDYIVSLIQQQDVNWVNATMRLLLSMFLGAAVGIERMKKGQMAGMRTFSLICTGATLAMTEEWRPGQNSGASGVGYWLPWRGCHHSNERLGSRIDHRRRHLDYGNDWARSGRRNVYHFNYHHSAYHFHPCHHEPIRALCRHDRRVENHSHQAEIHCHRPFGN